MAAPIQNMSLAVRGSEGIRIVSGPQDPQTDPQFQRVASANCKVMCFSQDGALFAYCDGRSIQVMTTPDFRLILQLDKPRTVEIEFSPKNTFVSTWEPYFVTKDNPHGSPNLNIWEVGSGRHVRGLYQKKHTGWEPQWSLDENVCGRNVNNEVQFYEENNFEAPVHKLHLQKVLEMKLTTKTPPPYHVAAYVPGTKGQPSFVRIYRYPNFGGPNAALANKSFYMADKVDLLWNNKGTALLVLTSTESSADSYYGDQGLHYISIEGESCLVPRGKNGPVYSVEWNPRSTDFCVVYGFMPAKATMYNTKCEAVFDFGTGPRNLAYYNPQGNVLSLAGFGNLGGNMEFWDVQTKNLISKTIARDTTFFEWCADGKHIVTATTAPRLRVGNGFKLWDFTGELIHEESVEAGQEIWDVCWQSKAMGVCPNPKLPFRSKGAVAAQEGKPQAYVPPGARNRPQSMNKPKYREDYELPSNMKKQEQKPENLSKAALKNKKKRESKARAKEQDAAGQPNQSLGPTCTSQALPEPVSRQPAGLETSSSTLGYLDPEQEKKIRNLSKKIRAIQQLKEQQAAGKHLELNQLEKLKTESTLLAELEQLKLG